ncbi:MAG: glycosyltransferase involved in cell wall biosynthesis [Flavobacteriales bacterium]|jgi:glycosyltransferase involved in cell wall biosynthesis|tara:strand:+ start:10691 stop:11878 length:1188 start_codon:yes stop_codon:yes gene_type:complete
MAFKILQITHKPPFPKIDGGCLEIAKMSNHYDSNKNIELDIFSLSTYKHPFIKNEFEKTLSNQVNLFSIQVNTKPSFFQAIRSLFTDESYNLNRFVNKEVIEKLTEIVENKHYDFIQFESIYTGQFISFLKPHSQATFILNAPNVEFNLWKQHASKATFIKKWYFNSLSKRLKKQEISIWNQMDGIICITKEIKETIEKNKIQVPTLVLPFKLDLKEYNRTNTNNNSPSFFHIGAMDWEPNSEGINWFITHIWNSISSPTKLHLAGKGMKNEDYKMDSVQVHGFVDNALDFINSYDIMIVPLLTGSGMRIKIIEAMALGKCVISTKKGAEGINYTDHINIWIANTPDEFKTVINQFIEDKKLAGQIGSAARKLVEEEYNSNNLDEELIPFFKTLK